MAKTAEPAVSTVKAKVKATSAPKRRVASTIPAAVTTGEDGLMNALEKIMADAGIEVGDPNFIPVPTGINVLDFYNARYFTERSEDLAIKDVITLNTGMPIGKIILLVGDTGGGKSTAAIQISLALVAPYAKGSVFHFDLESAWGDERTVDICVSNLGMTAEQTLAKYRRLKPAPLEAIYEFIKRMRITKLEAGKTDPTLWVENVHTGQRMLVPTVVIIDTVAALQILAIFEKMDIGSFMADPGVQAKANNTFAQRLAGMIGDANITIVAANHIRTAIADPTRPKRKRVMYMGADEAMPGGAGFPQYADYLLKMVPQPMDDAFKALGIHGKIVHCTIVKSRLSYDGRQFDLVLADNGFSNAWTNWLFLKSQKLALGGGAYMFVRAPDGRETVKFAQSHFAELYEGNSEFRDIVDACLEQELTALVPVPGSAAEAALLEEGKAVAAAEGKVEVEEITGAA
jgi:RecA/RadA recombinase